MAILDTAVALTTVVGLDGLSIGGLADRAGLSKSGLYAHFGSKEELQLATIEVAADRFRTSVVHPALALPEPVQRLTALCENFLARLENDGLPGGCFFVSVNAEFDTRPGVVRDRLAELHTTWLRTLQQQYAEVQAAGLLSDEPSPEQAAFELNAYLHMANNMYVLYRDAVYLQLARRSIANRLRSSRPAARSQPATDSTG